MGSVVDSGVLIQIERQGKSPSDLVEAFSEPLLISAMTVAELSFGLYRADSPQRRRGRESFIDAVINRFPVLAFDAAAAQVYARIWADLVSSGETIGAHDLVIAATAISNGFGVLTENARHFGRVPGLDVRRPNW